MPQSFDVYVCAHTRAHAHTERERERENERERERERERVRESERERDLEVGIMEDGTKQLPVFGVGIANGTLAAKRV